jgi:hypothetical protein
MVRDGAKDDKDQNVGSGLYEPATATKEESRSTGSPSSASAVTNDENVVTPHVDIIATLERQCAAWNAGDIKAYMNGYAEDAIYISQSILKTRKRASGTDKENDDICLHGRIAIETLFADVLERSREHLGRLSYRTLQIQYATTDRAFVMGCYEFVTSNNNDHKVVDAGVFTLDMAREYVAATATAGSNDDDQAREWKIKTEHASSSQRQRK